MKKLVSLILTLAMLLSVAAPALAENEAQTRIFVDSTGREVVVPAEITSIAVTGALGQIIVFSIAGDLFAGIPNAWDENEIKYIPEEYHDLPVLGQLYGGKGNMNPEELLRVNPQVVIDIGEPTDNVASDLDALTAQLGIPFVHISAYLGSMDETYIKLGELLGREEIANELAAYCANAYSRAIGIMENVEKVNMLYVTGEKGLNVLAYGSFHSVVLDTMANNVAVVDNPLSKGTGNEVDMEQILAWDPEYIIFSDETVYNRVGSDPIWQGMQAIQNDNYYLVPVGPHNWIGTPPSVQRLLGLMWMAELFYPEMTDYDLYTEVAEFYRLFYRCELTQEQYDELVEKSIGKSDE